MSASRAASAADDRRRRLGDILVAGDVITPDQLAEALARQQAPDGGRRRLGAVLADLGHADERHVAHALASQLGLDVVAGAALHAAPRAAVDLVPRRIATQYDLIPLDLDGERGELVVAIADPTNVVALDDLRALPGVRVVTLRIARASAIARARSLLYERGVADATVQQMQAEVAEDDAVAESDPREHEPVVRLVNLLLSDAIRSRASDVHVEPERAGVRVRYRVDGLLREVQHIPRQMAAAVTSRLKVMSSLDIAERRRPQDGRASISVDGQEVDLRVSTMPTLHGETTVLRLLRKGTQRLAIDDLGLDDDQRRAYTTAIARSQGLVVMTGPTGSGKTTTLYAGLTHLADPTRNVITLEDPVEYQLDGINQTQVDSRIGMGFATGLRAVLRQDPDVVMVGEIRDAETAELAVEASFTGHLVLSTLHTNDAPSTVARLAELGVERFLLGTTLSLVVAQRLVRRVCRHCATDTTVVDPDVLEQLGVTEEALVGATLRTGAGCVDCDGTGFRGRVGVYEVLQMSPRMRQLVVDGGSELQIGALARTEGMRSLRQDAVASALAGATTLAEVLRVTPDDHFQAGGDPEATAVRVGAIARHRVLAVGEVATELGDETPSGWEVSVASDAADAVARVEAEDPSVVVVHHGADPRPVDELLALLRDARRTPPAVVVRSPAALDPTRVRQLHASGASDVVAGHVDPTGLWSVLEAAAGNERH